MIERLAAVPVVPRSMIHKVIIKGGSYTLRMMPIIGRKGEYLVGTEKRVSYRYLILYHSDQGGAGAHPVTP